MEFNKLEYIIKVAELGNITKASDRRAVCIFFMVMILFGNFTRGPGVNYTGLR